MTIKFCPICNREYSVSPHSGDYVHQCNSGFTAVDNEDVVVLTTQVQKQTNGETITTGRSQASINYQGVANRLTGIARYTSNTNLNNFTIRGNREQTHRSRPKEVYIENPNEK